MSLNHTSGSPAGEIPVNESPISQHSPMGRVTFLKLKTQAMYKCLECIMQIWAWNDRKACMNMLWRLDSLNEQKSNFLAVQTCLEEHDFDSIGSDYNFLSNSIQI